MALRRTSPFLLMVLGIAALALFAGSPAEPAAAQTAESQGRLILALRMDRDSPKVCYWALGSWTAPDNVWLEAADSNGDVLVPQWSPEAEEWSYVSLGDVKPAYLLKVSNIANRTLPDPIRYSHKGTIFTSSAGEFADFSAISFKRLNANERSSVALHGAPARHPAVSPGEKLSWSGKGIFELEEDFGDLFSQWVTGRRYEPEDVPLRLIINGGFDFPPIADAGPEKADFEGGTTSLDGSGSRDAYFICPLTYKWTVPPDFGIVNADTWKPTLKFPYVKETTYYSIGLTVTDPFGLSSNDLGRVWVYDNPGPDPTLEVESVRGRSNGRVNIKIKLQDGKGNDYADEWYFRQPRGNKGCKQVNGPIATVKNLKPGQKYTIKAYSQEGCRHLLATLTDKYRLP